MSASNYSIIVNASGSAAAGVGPHFKLLIDNVVVGQASVTSAATSPYSFSANLTPGQAHDVEVVYDNDAVVNGQDRNLFLQSISVGGQTIAAKSSLEVYHATSGPGDIASSGSMYWNGAAEFKLPASDFLAPALASPAFFVATNGSDGGDGSAAHPFATLARAQTAMEGSATHTTYVEGGTYALTSALALTGSDSGFSFLAAPGAKPVITEASGSKAASLVTGNGANNVTLTGLSFENDASGPAVDFQNGTGETITGNYFSNDQEGILLDGTSSSTVAGNQIDNSGTSAVEAKNGANKDAFDSNSITGTGAMNTQGGAFYLHGANNATITHNAIANTAGAGIALADFDQHDTYTQNNSAVIEYNTITNANQGSSSTDSGALYIEGRSLVNTGDIVSNNLINGTGVNTHDEGIYLDDNATGVSVTSNIVEGVAPNSDATEIHGGGSNTFSNNIFDLGKSGSTAGLVQANNPDQPNPNSLQNNSYTSNVVASDGAPNQNFWAFINAPASGVSGSNYWDYTGAAVNTHPDSNSHYVQPSSTYAGLDATSGDGINFVQINQSAMGLHPATAHWYS